jgi:hypothetical protein
MSYIIVQYQKDISEIDLANLLNTESNLVSLTAQLFNKKPEEIIVDYVPFSTYKGIRKVLVRAETSVKNISLLETWASKIKLTFQGKIHGFGIKTFVEDSRWMEENN